MFKWGKKNVSSKNVKDYSSKPMESFPNFGMLFYFINVSRILLKYPLDKIFYNYFLKHTLPAYGNDVFYFWG